jgi:hypothetical protein
MSYWNGAAQFAASSLIPATAGVESGVPGSFALAPGTFGLFSTAGATSLTTAPNRAVYYTPSRLRTPYVQFYNFTIQRDLTHGILADVGYVGNLGRELPYTLNTNAALPGTGATGLPLNGAFGRTAGTFLRGTGFNSKYNSLQANITKRFSEGLSFSVAYTYSKSLDYGAGLTPFLNNTNPRANYGPSDFDRTHVFTLTHNWRLPFGTGTQHLNSGIAGRLLGPWQLDGILRHATGLPFTPTASAAFCQCPGNTPTADVVPGPPALGFTAFPSFFGFFEVPYLFPTIAFAQPANGSFGNVGRNAVRGPDFTNYDLSVSRQFVFVEHTRLEFRAEAYNLSNSTHFGPPIANVNSANFGLSTGTALGLGERTFQFALKLVY